MTNYLVETFYTCTFKIVHKLEKLNEKTLSELKNADICLVLDEKDPSLLIGSEFNKKTKKNYILVKTKQDLDSKKISNQKNLFLTKVKMCVG